MSPNLALKAPNDAFYIQVDFFAVPVSNVKGQLLYSGHRSASLTKGYPVLL